MKWSDFWLETRPSVRGAIRSVLRGAVGGMTTDDFEQEIAFSCWTEWEAGVKNTSSYWAKRAKWRTIDALRARKRFITHDLNLPRHEPAFRDHEPCVMDDLIHILGKDLTDGLLSGSLTKCAKCAGVSKATMSRLLTACKQKAKVEEELAMNGFTIKATGLKTGTNERTCRVYKGKGNVIVADASCDCTGTVQFTLRTPKSETDEVVKGLIAEIQEKFKTPDAPVREVTPKAAKPPRVKKEKVVQADVLMGKLPKTLDAYKKKLGWTPASGTKEAPIKEVHYCLCGCGGLCARNFLPGHDARFKGQLIRTKDPYRNAIMKDLGWEKYIGRSANVVGEPDGVDANPID